jgi:hypothetical protein
MEKPSRRNLFDDDSDEDDYKPGQAKNTTEETYKPQSDEMQNVKIDSTPTQE